MSARTFSRPLKSLFVCSVFSLCAPAFGTVYTTIDLANPLESLGHSARATAMGMALVAVPGDSSDLLWNPAGLSGISSTQLALNHDSWLESVLQETFILAVPFPKAGTFALGSTYVNYGNIDSFDSTGAATGSYQPYRLSASLGWGGELFSGFSLGLAVRGFQQAIVSKTYNSYFASMGVIWALAKNFEVAASYSDLGLILENYSTAGVLRAGLGWSILESKGSSTLLTAALAMPPYGVYRIQLGAEEKFLSDFFLRAGYQFDLVNNQIPGLQELTAGFGFRFMDFDLDYAFLPMGDLGSSQRVSLAYHFGEKQASPSSSHAAGHESSTNFTPPPDANALNQVEKVELKFSLPDNPAQEPTPSPSASRWTVAIQEYEKFLQEHPQNPQAWQVLGKLYFQNGRTGEALQCMEESLRLQPDNPALKGWLQKYKASNP